METEITLAELECYLDEALRPEEMARIESVLRARPELGERLVAIHRRRDAGVHSLGEIWRRHRISCPTRQDLGNLLLGVLDEGHASYVRFHLEKVGCRICAANLADMQARNSATDSESTARRRKYFQSSAGYLRAEK